MALALALWTTTIIIYYTARKSLVRLAGQFALMWSMILYPATVLSAVQLLICNTVTISAAGANGLNGGAAYAAVAGVGGLATLAVSTADPYFVC
jgi:hypothetical protein